MMENNLYSNLSPTLYSQVISNIFVGNYLRSASNVPVSLGKNYEGRESEGFLAQDLGCFKNGQHIQAKIDLNTVILYKDDKSCTFLLYPNPPRAVINCYGSRVMSYDIEIFFEILKKNSEKDPNLYHVKAKVNISNFNGGTNVIKNQEYVIRQIDFYTRVEDMLGNEIGILEVVYPLPKLTNI